MRVTNPGYAEALEELKEQSNTRWSPWHVLNGDDERAAAAKAMSILIAEWRGSMPSDPPRVADSKVA